MSTEIRDMQVGMVVECTATDVGQWGAYVVTKGGLAGFVDGMEFSWTSASTDHVAVGDTLTIKVTKILSDAESRGRAWFVGSIRQVHPELDPWFDPDVYRLGAELPAVVERSGDDFLLIRFETGALGLVLPTGLVGEPPMTGRAIVAVVVEVDTVLQKVRAELLM